MRGAAVAAAALVACGRIDYDPVIDGGADGDAATDALPACTAPYAVIGGSCYRMVEVPASWDAAQAACEADGAHLVIVGSVAEHDVVHGLLTDAGVTGGWVGASDRVAEDSWRWVGAGGVDLLADQCFFGAGGPANSAVLDCVASFATNFCGDYTLFLCSDSHPYVCERDGVAIDRAAF
ncbi:MAG: C-type lectin domain-containing protein [Myxococcales bacterium]|jgi:hypothetical protein|nr:C-type lectin domain-containing protein [Myxococcales bacterium]MBK7198063.1 C-type lectin domain-containing protein [Myxococcales bacterium]